ncbi:DUF3040 domain-containing protein [Microlunatus elymi]|nr:DUF3040 domain-containing protein [Microlunatus elymi]
MLTPHEERRLVEIERELADDPTLLRLASSLARTGRAERRRRSWLRRVVLALVWIPAAILLTAILWLTPAVAIAAGVLILAVAIVWVVRRGHQRHRR